jgi:nicotinic acid phosphoribosyltransferase
VSGTEGDVIIGRLRFSGGSDYQTVANVLAATEFMAKAAGASGHRAVAAGDAEASATAGTTDEAAAGREAAKEIVLTDESGEGGATISLEDPAALTAAGALS